jgi:xanthine dehydrogenase YagS FAD-binding subunit
MNSLSLALPRFEHIDVRETEEAAYWLNKYGDRAKIIAGATDLLSLMKDRVDGPKLKIPEVLINVKTIPKLNILTYHEEEGLRIGAAVRLNRIVTSPIIEQRFSLLSQAASEIGTTQLRNMGTLGGNICQRPRCIYFRNPDFPCRKKGGDICYARTGEHRDHYSIMDVGRCIIANLSDMAPALVALKAKAIITGPEVEKKMPIEDFFIGPNDLQETVLRQDELLTEIQIPCQKKNTYQAFLKQRVKPSASFALTSVAVVARIWDEICREIRIVVGGIAPYPYIFTGGEEMLRGRRLSEELISTVSEASIKGARPLPMNGYKVNLMKATVRQILSSVRQASLNKGLENTQ